MTAEYVGPRSATPELFEATVALANRNFRASSGDMGKQYPLLFHPQHLEQLRLFTAQGKPVSLVGMVVNDVVLQGCSTKIACVGSVCTDEWARGKGLAGRLIDDAAERATAAGAGVMLISGGRTLYTRRGATQAGLFHRYTITAERLRPEGQKVSIVEVSPDQCVQALRICEAEPIRFRRTEQEYALQIACRWTLDQPGSTYLVQSAAGPVAVVSANCVCSSRPDAATILGVYEMAGDRRAGLAALPQITETNHAETVVIDAYATDSVLRDACAALGADPKLVAHSGIVKLLDAGRLWQGYAPLLRERIGEAASELQLETEADELKIHTLTFRHGGESLTLRGHRELTAALFGAPGLEPMADYSGALADLLGQALPLPLPLYGLNYV